MSNTAPSKPRTYVYIDGFNLYNRAYSKHPAAAQRQSLKWLDLVALARHVLPHNDVVQVRYFTAKIRPSTSDPDAPKRQHAYLRALSSLPELSIHLGQFRVRDKLGRVVRPAQLAGRHVTISTFEEKGSDVNMAVWALRDGYEAKPDVSVFLTGDSDLAEAGTLLQAIGITVGVILPAEVHYTDADGKKIANRRPNKIPADFLKTLRITDLRSSQLPATVTLPDGKAIHRPRLWR